MGLRPQVALHATQEQRDGERYAALERRREAAVAGAWTAGRADPRVAAELDRFMAAAERRLGEAGMHAASRAASDGRGMAVPGAGSEHQAGLDTLARSFILGRQATEYSRTWAQRLGREEKVAERERAPQQERQVQALPPEPPREQPRQGRGLGFSR